ncbi:sodium:proton antiporter [Ammoniphilus oxalaticus]|uniref:Sodium:proton antiporter n=1 Tax=Ammoniphilus oxalaticus TaxID=66863 RepID=A0A419SLQ0_9BACL|nr:cation:proton antiporter [Ammoniphilus oxalaticus]RKD24988.1 sodium:proton antiporter [Ammoniphilus oxalaticus]
MLIVQLAIILIASKIAGDISVRLNQPSVLGKLLVGILLGPTVLGLIENTQILHEISQLGVILLMFIAGLETSLGQFRQTGKAAVYVGLAGIIAPVALGFAMGELLGLSGGEALFIGLLLAATSVSISVQALRELGMLQSKEGTTILGAAVIDDVVVIVLLAFLMSTIGGDVALAPVLLRIVAFFFIVTILSFCVPFFVKRFSRLRVTEATLTAGVIVCFLFAALAEYSGVAAIIGAYVAGIAINVTRYGRELTKKVETISYSLFVPVFFASIGLSVDFSGIGEYFYIIVLFSALAIVSKLVGGALGAKAAGFTWGQSMGIGSAMVSRGEVALIIAGIGLQAGFLNETLFSVMIIVVLVTTLVTPPLMKWFFARNQTS